MPTEEDDGSGARGTLHGANTMALEDFDGDGDLDLFWGDFFEPGVLLKEYRGRGIALHEVRCNWLSDPEARRVVRVELDETKTDLEPAAAVVERKRRRKKRKKANP